MAKKKLKYATPEEYLRMNKRRNYELRNRHSMLFAPQKPTRVFRVFFNEHVLPLLEITGYKQAKKKAIALGIAQQLIQIGLWTTWAISDTRETSRPQVRMRTQLWDAFVAAGLAVKCLGSESSGRQTLYRATPQLLTIREQWNLNEITRHIAIKRTKDMNPSDYALVEVRSKEEFDPVTGQFTPTGKKPFVVKLNWQQDINLRNDLEGIVDRINESNTSHAWQAWVTDPSSGRRVVIQPDVRLREIHQEQLFRGCRLYTAGPTGAQNLPKAVRESMLIDSEPVGELDFAGHDTRILYHRVGLDPKGDIYVPEKVLPKLYGFKNLGDDKKAIARDFVKTATNICLHVSSQGRANSSVGKLLAEHVESKYLKKVIYKTEGTTIQGIVKRIVAAHEVMIDRFAKQLTDIGSPFFTKYGMELMATDGQIMRSILLEFANADKPALGIHDAILCKRSDLGFAKRTMIENYRHFMMFEPVIKRTF